MVVFSILIQYFRYFRPSCILGLSPKHLHLYKYEFRSLISEIQYPFIGVLECKFNLDGLLQVNYEHGP